MTGAQTKDYSREGVGRKRGLQQGRKDNFACISSCVGLVLNFPRMERVLVQIWQHISKIQSDIYPFVVNTIWVDWMMVCQWRVLPIDQQFHFLRCFGGPET